MTQKIHIADPATGLKAEVVNGEEENALVVASRPLKTFENKVKFFTDDNGNINMNIDASAGGTPVKIHDGIDSILWTGSAISGSNWDFSDAAQNHTAAGAASVSGILLTAGDISQFAKGSNQDLTGYVSITLWIWVVASWSSLDVISIYGWDTGTVSIIGSSVDLGNYINTGDTGVWQQAVIPLGDLGLTNETIDSIRVEYTVRSGTKASFYMDDIQIEETGASVDYYVKPNKGTWLHVENMLVSIADEYDGTLADATMPKIPYDSILGVSELSSGIRWVKMINGKIKSAFIMRKLMDALELPSASLVNFGDDGTDVWFTLNFKFTEPLLLKSRDDDHLKIILNDLLTGLKHFRISVGCKEEIHD